MKHETKMARQTSCVISRNGENLGPWSIETVAQKLASAELSVTDFAWDERLNDWVTLMEFAELKAHLQARKPAAPAPRQVATAVVTNVTTTAAPALPMTTQASTTTPDDSTEWFVNRGQQRFGPFNYFGIIKALQDKAIFEFDYVWCEGMDGWQRIAEHERFTSETIRSLLSSLELSKTHIDVFAQRRHARIQIESEVLVHDNSNVSQGRMVEASVGGSGIVIQNATLMPGQLVHVHHASLEGLPAFNAVAEIVSKKYSKPTRDTRAATHYGVRFVKMDSRAQDRIKNFVQETAKGESKWMR